MKTVILENTKYNLIIDYKGGFDQEELENRYTDYFNDYDYIVGDWSYGKLRLKGFCKKENNLYKPLNDYENKNDYLRNNCAYDCKYFVLEKIKIKEQYFLYRSFKNYISKFCLILIIIKSNLSIQ